MTKIQTYAFADEACEKIDEQINPMKRNNLDGLEIRGVDGVNISDITNEKARDVKNKMDSAGLVIWSMGSPIGKIDIEKDDFSAHLDKFRHTLELADILGAKNIRLFSFFIPKGKQHDDYKNEVIDRLGKFVDVAKGSGINLCHENEKDIYGDIACRCLEIHKALPEIKGIFDPANYVQCGQDTIKAWEMLDKYIYYMHIKDALPDGTVVPAGKGSGNLNNIVSKFIKQGGTSFTIEPHLTVFNGFADLEQDSKISEIGKKYIYANNNEAFDAACSAFNIILKEAL